VDEQHLQDTLIVPTVHSSDVEQERFLIHLTTGKPLHEISKQIIVRRLRGQERSLLSNFESEMSYSPLWQESNFTGAQLETIEQILIWVSDKPQEIQDQVNEFLEDPNLTNLSETISLLEDYHLIPKQSRRRKSPIPGRRRPPTSLTQLIIRALISGPREIEDLYQMARNNSNARRPEAAVRQTLRRLKGKNIIAESEQGVYSWIASSNLSVE